MKANKVSRKGMKVNRFTQEEVEQLQTAMTSGEYKNENRLAVIYAEKFNRSYATVYAKVRSISGKDKPKAKKIVVKQVTKVTKAPVAKVEVVQEVKPLTLPEGMTYQGKAKKVELHADHFRVYF